MRTIAGARRRTAASSRGLDQLGLQASWEPDLWGKIGNTVSQARAQAQASEADLANATLSAQAELALDYVQLRGIEAQKVALDATVVDYERALTITTNLYNAGVSARADVLQAETALRNARGDAADLIRQRALLEHAIAVLVGENPSRSFSIAPAATWNRAVPEVPGILPAELLERRPDIASAERGVAAANANIGIQRAAFFPRSGSPARSGRNPRRWGHCSRPRAALSRSGSPGVLTLLDFGARTAKVDQARAICPDGGDVSPDVLTAFQQVEDQLAAVRVLDTVATERAAAATAANAASGSRATNMARERSPIRA